MLFNLNKLVEGKTTTITYEPDFSKGDYKCNFPLISVNSCSATVELIECSDILSLSVKGFAKVTFQCCNTLEKFDDVLKFHENLEFGFDKNDTDLDYIGDSAEIDLDDYVFAILSSSVPVEVHKKGTKLPESGKGYRVITDEELAKEKEEAVDPRFACLDDIDLQ